MKAGATISLVTLTMFAVAPVCGQDDHWEYRIAPYLWAPSVNGELRIGDVSADIDLPIGDILREHLDLVGMLNMEARKGRWGLLMDGVYMKISPESELPGPFLNTIETTIGLGALVHLVAEEPGIDVAGKLVQGIGGHVQLLSFALADGAEAGRVFLALEAALDVSPARPGLDQSPPDPGLGYDLQPASRRRSQIK